MRARAERAAKRAEKEKAKDVAERLARNDWIPIDGMWAARALEGRGHREGPYFGRKYRVHVPVVDFGEYLFRGGEVRFLEISGGDCRIFGLPKQVDGVALAFDFEIDADAIGGSMIYVSGLEERAPM